LHVFARCAVGECPIDGDAVELAVEVLVEAADPGVADPLSADPVLLTPNCQAGLYDLVVYVSIKDEEGST
jgi:hypothetical protein